MTAGIVSPAGLAGAAAALRRGACWLLLLICLLLLAPAQAGWSSRGEPYPTVTMQVAHFAIGWRIYPTDTSRITEAILLVNGQPVPTRFFPHDGVLSDPDIAWPPGPYRAQLRVVVDRDQVVDRAWSFSVAHGALASLPLIRKEQEQAWTVANQYRERLELPFFHLEPRLCAAATAHALYLARNETESGHGEEPHLPGFSGRNPSERAQAFGWPAGAGEDLGGDVNGLFDAPYHRLPFLEPGPVALGTGWARGKLAMLFNGGAGEGVVVYPFANQLDAPIAWHGGETPDPLRLHKKLELPVGYIITLACFGGGKITPTRAALLRLHRTPDGLVDETRDGEAVPIAINSSLNDDALSHAVFLIPEQPLQPDTIYQVMIQAHTDNQLDVSRMWRFKTALAEQQQALAPLHRAAFPVAHQIAWLVFGG